MRYYLLPEVTRDAYFRAGTYFSPYLFFRMYLRPDVASSKYKKKHDHDAQNCLNSPPGIDVNGEKSLLFCT